MVSIEESADSRTLVLDRADKANALSSDMVEQLIAAIDDAHATQVPLILLRGAGRNFSAGFDFSDIEAQSEGDLLHRFVRIEHLLQSIAHSPSMTVGFAHGRNFGAGVDLFAACRHRVAAPGTTFRMPGLAFGLQLGTRRFAAIVGTAAAGRILGGLQIFDDAEALSLGFLHEIADASVLERRLEPVREATRQMPFAGRAALHRALARDTADADLADLVRSVAVPGLKTRIRSYLAVTRRP